MTGNGAIRYGILAACLGIIPPDVARADGGTVLAWRRLADWDVAVFVEPFPVVVGPVDLSVLVLDHATGEPVREARIVVEIAPRDRPEAVTAHEASERNATNKLFRAAAFTLRSPGSRVGNIAIDAAGTHVDIPLKFDVGIAWSVDVGITPWVVWPVGAIGLFTLHQVRKKRLEMRRKMPRS